MNDSAVSIPNPVVSDVRKKDADYVFYELTRSICPNCKKVIDAKILLRDNKVFMAKRCPDCGPFEALVYGDAEAYTSFSKFNKPGTIPLAYGSEIKDGCPYDCGLHPQIIDFVKAAKDRGIPFVMINTNGKRIAHDDRFLEQLSEVRPSIYFQFDGFDAETYRIIRGEPGILEEKLRALDRLASIGLSVTLVPAIERGVNEHEIGNIIELAIRHPAVRGINFQPAFHAGRHMQHDPLQRITIPDVLKLIEQQTAGKFLVSDFIPVPCCFPTCNSVTYAFIDGEQVTPLSRIVNVYDYLDYITNRVLPDFSMEVKRALEGGLWSSSSVPGSQKSAEQFAVSCQACGIPETFTIGEIAKNVLMIMLQDFMDPWTFNQKNLMKCCKEFLLPGGKQIPFCAYNTVGYREQARVQLEAMESRRKQARRDGQRYEPQAVVFDMKANAGRPESASLQQIEPVEPR